MEISRSKNSGTVILIPSKNRALQLDGALKTLKLHCKDLLLADLKVIYKVTEEIHREQYNKLIIDFPEVKFIEEVNIKEDIINHVLSYKYLLLVVDDNIFVRDFYLTDITACLDQESRAVGFSLRLGKNTTYCYMAHKPQPIPPDLSHVAKNIYKYDWTDALYDFGFPFETSSTVYRLADVGPMITNGDFSDINLLEYVLAGYWDKFMDTKNIMFCYEYSATFCNPLNIVQESYPLNRKRKIDDYSVENLVKRYQDGYRLKADYYSGFLPISCHQEMEMFFENINPEPQTNIEIYELSGPLVSVIIPCYNSGSFLHDAVKSIVRQTYKNSEIIIVDDGSIDNTSKVAETLIEHYPQQQISLIRKANEDTAETRNKGIRAAKGEWILPLDSDDFFKNSFLEKAFEIIKKDPSVNLVATNVQIFAYSNGEWILPEYSPENILKYNNFVYASLYKKELWEKAGGYDPSLPWGNEDWNFWISCSAIGINPVVIAEKLFLYRDDIRDSRYKILRNYEDEVKAMIYTLHPGLYARNIILKAHETIAAMHINTCTRLTKINKQFKDLPMPYLWLGLYQEKNGNIESALQYFQSAAELAKANDWQPFLKLSYIYKTLNDNDRAQESFRELQRRKSG
jgi:glycosyltransferase involved in cell wall biosynthesis